MTPFLFGSSGEPLFGIYHPPVEKQSRKGAVVLCNPFGQEAVHAHRMFRVLADHLSRIGFHVLRFDYFATGDSCGDCGEGSLGRWVDDVLVASDELLDTAGVRQVALVGLRLGGMIAAMASVRRPVLTDLVLWDPVTNGSAYLDELRRAHVALLANDIDFPKPHPFATATMASEIDQALGFRISPTLHREIRELDIRSLAGASARRIFVIANSASDDLTTLQSMVDARGASLSYTILGQSELWNSERALNSAVVPMDSVNAVIRCLSESND